MSSNADPAAQTPPPEDDAETRSEDTSESLKLDAPFWNVDIVPPESDEHFQRAIHGDFEISSRILDNVTWVYPPITEKQSYTSIGDQGTTASINAYGEIIQFGSYFGVRASGTFVVDQSFEMPSEPYMVKARAEELESLSRERIALRSQGTFGLDFPKITLEKPRLSYLGYRWPRYEYRTETFELVIQWMVRDGVVLQQCLVTNLGSEDVDVPFTFRNPEESMNIRDLDYLDGRNRFNDHMEGYRYSVGPHNYSWCQMHEFAPVKDQNDGDSKEQTNQEGITMDGPLGAVAVIVCIFLNGSAMTWSDRGPQWQHPLKGSTKGGNLSASSTMEVVCSYKMVYLPSSKADTWEDLFIPAKSVDVTGFLRQEPQAQSSFALALIDLPVDTSNGTSHKRRDSSARGQASLSQSMPTGPQIEFLVCRNLENVLSNCTIPLETPSKSKGGALDTLDPSDGVVPIALTCGDISGHRVCTSASFFAFWYLVEAAKRLKHLESQDPYVCWLLERITAVCQGHLRWLEQAERISEDKFKGCFAANYWVTGKIMTLPSQSWTPPDSLTDTAFQLIKAATFSEVYAGTSNMQLSQRAILDVCEPWIEALDKLDKRSSFAWPHTQAADTNVFRLDDHVWIWKGIKSIEDLGLWTGHQLKTLDKDLFRTFNPSNVQREMLRRFTTENSVSRKRMLAVTRSSLETRFLFHARDTALFYGSAWDFFLQDTSFREVWDNSIEAQAYHNGNQETVWDNALRYALAIVMGTRNHRINKRLPVDVVKSSLAVLLQSTGPNGFFPGQLDSTTKEPILFFGERDRDFYFHASFEVPFVLLYNAVRINSMCQSEPKSPTKTPKRAMTEPNMMENEGISEISVRLTTQPKLQPLEQEAERDHASTSMLDPKAFSMKKTLPYSRFIDMSSIVNVDEEWLYNYPAFLSGGKELSPKDLLDQLTELQSQGIHASGAVLSSAIKPYLNTPVPQPRDEEQAVFRFSTTHRVGMVIDTAKNRLINMGRQSKNISQHYTLLDNLNLWIQIKSPRTAQKAKKRFIWLPSPDPETALACFASSPESERGAISLFFDRHSDLTGYFYDDTTMYLNTWETEIHLSFYQLLPQGVTKFSGIPEAREEKFPGRQERRIMKASMGFRFMGDFFDRYWTCHFIEYVPARGVVDDKVEEVLRQLPFKYWSRDDRTWRQRKVLELHLFESILTTLLESTEGIYNVVRSEFGLQKGAFTVSITNSDEYFSADWQKFQYMLEAVERELAAGLSIISKWEARDKDRGQEKPRWTRNDEQNYGTHIKKLLGSTNRKIRDMKNVHDNIRTLKETLISSQEHIRDDLSLRGAEDVRFFTYVTVVFLPLGFASSLFSMSDSPSSDLISSMAICAIVALAVTLVALINAKTIGIIIGQSADIFDKYYGDYTRATMHRSSLVKMRKEKRQLRASPSDEENVPQQGFQTEKTNRSSFKKPAQKAMYLWFWLVYLLIEYPARRVLLAHRALKWPQFDWATFLNIVLGILFLPLCMTTWLIQVFFYNVVDFLRLVFDWAIWLLPSTSLGDGDDFSRNMALLTNPPNASRPIRALNSKFSAIRTRWASSEQAAKIQAVKEETDGKKRNSSDIDLKISHNEGQ